MSFLDKFLNVMRLNWMTMTIFTMKTMIMMTKRKK